MRVSGSKGQLGRLFARVGCQCDYRPPCASGVGVSRCHGGSALGKQQLYMKGPGNVRVGEGDRGHDLLLCDREFGDAVSHFESRYTKVKELR